MYLKSIEVYGFKSFANKIVFQFNNGITGIVGPNGSGKSNVADAMRWVLGEQSAKQLRGAKMEDVIFAGTELRKPHGSAYVAITLDNSDHSLPVDYEEVTVARRVYRSGESEYLLNGTPCRLKDINSMFFDTGIGKEGYSIIGQGQIEKILSGKPEERRELFDEAAGIVKYKKNKAATEKSLENERMNLDRVNDILSELEKQVGPLEHQAEVAKKYLLYRDELRRFDVNAFLLDTEKTKISRNECEKNLAIITGEQKELQDAFEQTKDEYDRLETQLEAFDQIMNDMRNQMNDWKLQKERDEGEIKVLAQQIDNVRLNDTHIQEQVKRIEKEIHRQEDDKNHFLQKQQELRTSITQADATLQEAKEASEGIQNRIDDLEHEIEESKGTIIAYMNEGSNMKAKVGRYDAMLENIQFRKTQLNQRYLQFKSDEMKDQEQYKKFQDELSTMEQEITEKQAAANQCEAQLNLNIAKNRENRDLLTRLHTEYGSTKSKLEALRNITERYDGYGNSIRRVMEQKERQPGIIGVVADILSVNRQYEVAVETALGGSIQNIVTKDETTAKNLIQYLKQNKYGRATFLPLTSLSNKSNFSKPEALKEPGVIGLASELVNVKQEYRSVAESLLGRILVVDHMDHAIAVAKKYHYSLRMVTVDGELLTPGGAMTGGAYKNASNLLGRKRELEELSKQAEQVGKRLRDAEKLEADLKELRDQLKLQKEEYSNALQELYLKKNTIFMNLEQVQAHLVEHTQAFASIQKENKELENQIEEIQKNKNQIFEGNKAQEQAKSDCEARIHECEEQIAIEKDQLKIANEKVSALLVQFNSVKQQEDFIQENLRRIQAELQKCQTEKEEYLSQTDSVDSQIQLFTEKIESKKHEITTLEKQIADETKELEEKQEIRNDMMAKHKEFFAKRESLNEEITRHDKESFRLQSQLEKLEEIIESLAGYMWEEYELTYQTALEFRDPELTDLSSLKREVSAVKNKIKALGDVNVNAIEDYKSVSERYEFLKTQHDDIVKAEQNLVQIIEELDAKMRELFQEKFAEIQHMFDKVFKELFGGGKASLVLVEDMDILEAGIKIIAQPPGKKLQNMMQLSGGEKSLTAIALLFAIQSLKPSPFCLLDEIEAALDDSNVKRFANYLHKLTKDTQFIVITHRKGTMEAADILYGITMQEKGVSTLVSVNLIENELDK